MFSLCPCKQGRKVYNEAMVTKSISSTEDRKTFYGIAREAIEDDVPVTVRNRGHKTLVIMPESEYRSIQETLYLMSGRNGDELRESMRQKREGMGRNYSMEELYAMLDE